MMHKIEELLELANAAHEQKGRTQGDMAVVVEMADGTVIVDCENILDNPTSSDGADYFKDLLAKVAAHGDGRVNRVVNVWETGAVEMICAALRIGLQDINPENENTVVYFPGRNFTLKELRPPKK